MRPLPRGARAILDVVRAFHPQSPSPAEVGAYVGIDHRSSTMRTYLARLRKEGAIERCAPLRAVAGATR